MADSDSATWAHMSHVFASSVGFDDSPDMVSVSCPKLNIVLILDAMLQVYLI